jgi:hypothetical protein
MRSSSSAPRHAAWLAPSERRTSIRSSAVSPCLRDRVRRVELALAVERARVLELRHAPARGVQETRDHARDRIVVVREHDQADRVALDEPVKRHEHAHGRRSSGASAAPASGPPRLRGAVEPVVAAAVDVAPPGLLGEPEVLGEDRGQVPGRLAREHALHHVEVARIALRLLLEDPAARLRAEDVLALAAHQRLGAVALGRALAEHELTGVAERDDRGAVRGEVEVRVALAPARVDALPDRRERRPRRRILLREPRALFGSGHDESRTRPSRG